ncbi:MAG: iron-sulfur cluster biosynthesis transcriptional regulator SufR [Kaiparowitsia implicata GSE-PSE-MK54-09C]|jgi:DeoR family suf operon transcriptional repressor|nr:iron-sulfur cluster biosynthesis transcriptional regulator SufR [Kaiparowitsia implicata GSE-PSE-MK54-09C]
MTTTQQSSTKQDILDYLLKQGHASAHTVAEQIGISPQAVRRHLKDLEEEALIEHRPLQEGMGRPSYVYQLTQKGRDRLPERYDDFALSLLTTLAETVGKDKVGDILRMQWQRKALDYCQQVGSGSLQERLARLVALRQAEGYMAEWHPVVSGDEVPASASADAGAAGDRFVITEYNCAISQIAESFPSVCGHELELFQMALQDCSVERTHWIVDGEHRCGYLIQMDASLANSSNVLQPPSTSSSK